jgi:hypothetical protein
MGTKEVKKKAKRKNYGFIDVELNPSSGEFTPTMEFAIYDLYAKSKGPFTQQVKHNKSFSHCLEYLRRQARLKDVANND